MNLPSRMVLVNPGPPLIAMSGAPGSVLRFGDSSVAEIWALTGVAALGRPMSIEHRQVELDGTSNGVRFARALGVAEILTGGEPGDWGEPGRTVKLHRLQAMNAVEPLADRISRLIAASNEASQETLYYVIVEMLRNVVQHSQDSLGGLVGAQAMAVEQQHDRPAVQVAVADNGIGILEHLKRTHPDLTDPGAAIEKALRAHISGTFREGETGSRYNAGFGLFAIAELAKLTGGRLLVASRGAALSIQGDREETSRHRVELLGPKGTGFPGTLVVFELPLEGATDFAGLMEEVRKRAALQTPARTVHRWITYDAAPAGERRILIGVVREDVEKAERLSRSVKTSLLAGEPIVLDFAGINFVTQSFLHALLFSPLRIAWAERQPVHVVNAAPAVRSALETLEQYALGG